MFMVLISKEFMILPIPALSVCMQTQNDHLYAHECKTAHNYYEVCLCKTQTVFIHDIIHFILIWIGVSCGILATISPVWPHNSCMTTHHTPGSGQCVLHSFLSHIMQLCDIVPYSIVCQVFLANSLLSNGWWLTGAISCRLLGGPRYHAWAVWIKHSLGTGLKDYAKYEI